MQQLTDEHDCDEVVHVEHEVVLAALVEEAVDDACVHPDGELREVEQREVAAVARARLLVGVRRPARGGIGVPRLLCEDAPLERGKGDVQEELPRLLCPLFELDWSRQRRDVDQARPVHGTGQPGARSRAHELDARDECVGEHEKHAEERQLAVARQRYGDEDNLDAKERSAQVVQRRVGHKNVLDLLHA